MQKWRAAPSAPSGSRLRPVRPGAASAVWAIVAQATRGYPQSRNRGRGRVRGRLRLKNEKGPSSFRERESNPRRPFPVGRNHSSIVIVLELDFCHLPSISAKRKIQQVSAYEVNPGLGYQVPSGRMASTKKRIDSCSIVTHANCRPGNGIL
jgi:hypothetical protein